MPRPKKTEDGENVLEEQVEQQQEGAVGLEPVPANIKVYFDSMKAQMDGLYAAMQTKLSTSEIELKYVQDNIDGKKQDFELKVF